MDIILAVSTFLLALFTAFMAYYTRSMARETVNLAKESREASFRQIRVQVWLEFCKRFDSPEILKARDKMALLMRITPEAPKQLISDTLMNFFEDLAIVYRTGYIDKELAKNTFSYFVCRWWEASKLYVDHERQTHNKDQTIFAEFENLAKEMRLPNEIITRDDVAKFLQDEKDIASET